MIKKCSTTKIKKDKFVQKAFKKCLKYFKVFLIVLLRYVLLNYGNSTVVDELVKKLTIFLNSVPQACL